MKSIEAIAAGNDAYRTLRSVSDAESPEAIALQELIITLAPVYHKVGAAVCRDLVELAGDDSDYTAADYLIATYDALAGTTPDDTPGTISRRALHRLMRPQVVAPAATPEAATGPTEALTQEAAHPNQVHDSPITESREAGEQLAGTPPEPLTATDIEPQQSSRAERLQREHDLCQRVSEGDQEAMMQLIRANRGLLRMYVNRAAAQLSTGTMDWQDLYQEAVIYALHQAKKYTAEHDKFYSTYLTAYLSDYLTRIINGRYGQYAVYVPESTHDMINQANKLAQYRREHGQPAPTDREIAKDLCIPEGPPADDNSRTTGNIHQAILLTRRMGSVEGGLGADPAGILPRGYSAVDRQNVLPLTTGELPKPETEAEQAAFNTTIRELLAELDERTEKVMRLRYGLDDGIPKTLKETAAAVGMSRQWVRNTELATLAKLGEGPYAGRLRDFVVDTDPERARIVALRKARADKDAAAHRELQATRRAIERYDAERNGE